MLRDFSFQKELNEDLTVILFNKKKSSISRLQPLVNFLFYLSSEAILRYNLETLPSW